ncbi:MAG TPA: ACP S-malonyltransferase [Blastocatellia bacterium]|nr:ACP S-malonyltransferase [Blastocatellia bacterium]
MKTAFVFPGQGAQKVGMGQSLIEACAAAKVVFEQADEALGMRLSSLCFEGPEEELRLTENTQPAILATSIAALRCLEAAGARADFVAGHSLGEYSALVAAGALRFEDALRVVRQRGQFMQEAVPAGEGAMAALLGADIEMVEAVCREASERGVCSPANINSPTQVVVAGHKPAVEYAVTLAKQRGVRRAVMLAVSAPFHCALMQPAAERLAAVLAGTAFADLNVPLITNVDAATITSGEQARAALVRQVASPVRWGESVKQLLDAGVTRFVELGPGKVLSGLIKQMQPEAQILNVEDAPSLEATAASVGF